MDRASSYIDSTTHCIGPGYIHSLRACLDGDLAWGTLAQAGASSLRRSPVSDACLLSSLLGRP